MQLRKEKKYIFMALSISLVFILSFFLVVRAGSLTPPTPFGTTMHSLLEIWDIMAGDFETIVFTGTGEDDMSIGGTFTGSSALNYSVRIDSTGPDTFIWSADGGSTWDPTPIVIDGTAQTLSNGVTVTFVGTINHDTGDIWDFSTDSLAKIDGNVIQQLKYISSNLGGSAITTLQGAYNNSSPATITTTNNKDINFTLANTATDSNFKINIASGSTGLFQITDNGTSMVFSVDNAGNIIMGASTLTASDSVRITSGGQSDLVLDAGSGKIQAAASSTFFAEGGYAIAASGEEILRGSMRIFGYDYPAQTASSSFIQISRPITLETDSFPSAVAGTTRIYKISLRYATNDASAASSTWQVFNVTDGPPHATFSIPPTTTINLDEGTIYITPNAVTIPGVGKNWRLNVQVPAGVTIRVYSVDLMAYDRVD